MTWKKIGLVCHDISESSIDFYFIFCSFISCKEAKKKKKTCLLLGEKKRSYIGFKIKYINVLGDIFYSLMGTFEWRYEDNGKGEKQVSRKGTIG